MSKQKVVVRKFKCRGAGSDCPPVGFEVVDSKNVGLEKHAMLTDSQLDALKAKKVQVVVTR